MLHRPAAILSSLITAFCPVICAVEATLHAAEEAVSHVFNRGLDEHDDHAETEHPAPHHQHDSTGDPIPVSSHACLCSTGALTPGGGQLPSLAPVAFFNFSPSKAVCAGTALRAYSSLSENAGESPPAIGGSLPLLI